MVDAYATTHGKVTLAVDAERFLFEESKANIVLALQPAVAAREGARPRPFEHVESFTARADGLSVTWQPVAEWQAATKLERLDENRYLLSVSLTNVAAGPSRPGAFHPLYFAAEGPGACGLGFERLRTWATHAADAEPRLRTLQGAMSQDGFGLWFGESGSPMLLLGAQGDAADRRIVFSGARGKIASLRIDEPAPTEDIAPGETWGPVQWLIVFGDLDIAAELRRWAQSQGLQAPEFDPMGETAPDPEPPEQEPDLAIEDPEPEEEPEEDEEPEEEEEDEADQAESEDAETESLAPAPTTERGVARCAEFHRAWRRTRQYTKDDAGFWPRWAAGRAYPPIQGASTRTRDRWRRDH